MLNVFENEEILVINEDYHEEMYILLKTSKSYYVYDYSWSCEYENQEEGFYIEMRKHNISEETIEEFKNWSRF